MDNKKKFLQVLDYLKQKEVTMDLTVNSYQTRRNPNFTARVKGPAVLSAIKKASSSNELGEIQEILFAADRFGDKATELICETDGSVTVKNAKFGKFVHKIKFPLNEKSRNPLMDVLRRFSTDNGVINFENEFITCRFNHAKEANKKNLYNLFKSNNLSRSTSLTLDAVARKQGIIPVSGAARDFTLDDVRKALFPEFF